MKMNVCLFFCQFLQITNLLPKANPIGMLTYESARVIDFCHGSISAENKTTHVTENVCTRSTAIVVKTKPLLRALTEASDGDKRKTWAVLNTFLNDSTLRNKIQVRQRRVRFTPPC